MEYGEKLAEGKTKIVYVHPDEPALVVLVHKDWISAGDGARRNELEGKGALSGRTSANVFTLLNAHGIPTHFIAAPSPTETIVKRCQMIPVEVVMRRRATGSYLKRHPQVEEGERFDPILVEFFLKDDARHDPQISEDDMVSQGIASTAEVEQMTAQGRRVFEVLEQAWAGHGVELIDLKIEFGRDTDGTLIVADMIDNDSWRLWPGGDKNRMLDKQIYRNMQTVTEEGLTALKQRYAQVAELTEQFVVR
jgi:phosphoribosylaminoimidazole-succinocarboxamide synthase